MSDAFLGEIAFFAFDKLPKNWLPCDGRSLNVQQYVALASLLGAYYGGDGRTTFNLPDLRGRAIVGSGLIPDNNHRVVPAPVNLPLGTAGAGGAETITLGMTQMAAHNHLFNYPGFPICGRPPPRKIFFQRFDQIACVHMSGLLVRSHMNAGQDGFRDESSKQMGDLIEGHWEMRNSPRHGSIDHTICLLTLQVLASVQHGCS